MELFALISCLANPASAQLAVSESGTVTYSHSLAVAPGRGGMAPQLSLQYSGGGGNGPVGAGWSLQGYSAITRCPQNRAIDGLPRNVMNNSGDRLCMDGQPLIRVDSAGVPYVSPAIPTDDAKGMASGYLEFRTERDSFSRIRSFGLADPADASKGPAYFKVWTKAGQVYYFGTHPAMAANSNGRIANTEGIPVAWALSRVEDTASNYMDFFYERREAAWGSGSTSSYPKPGMEWNLVEIQYGANVNTASPHHAKVVLAYSDRASPASPPVDTPPPCQGYNCIPYKTLPKVYGATPRVAALGVGTIQSTQLPPPPQDAQESYHLEAKMVSLRRLASITAYAAITAPGKLGPDGKAVRTTKVLYEIAPVSGRSRVSKLTECAGDVSSTACLPGPSFTYSAPESGNESITLNSKFNLSKMELMPKPGVRNLGILLGDFNGDGRTDILRWHNTPALNQLWLSKGDGSFTQIPNGTSPGQFNLPHQLFRDDGCFTSFVSDFDGDGLVDIVRTATSKNKIGLACPTATQAYAHYFKNDGKGQFTPVRLTLDAASGGDLPVDQLTVNAIDGIGDAGVIGYSEGRSTYFLDLNQDGFLDAVHARYPATSPAAELPDCSTGCTRVFMGKGNGQFSEVASNVKPYLLYSNPGNPGALTTGKNLADLDGDGLTDIIKVGGQHYETGRVAWRSRGDGNFEQTSFTEVACDVPIDFNGDGRADCLSVGDTSAKTVLQASVGTNRVMKVADFRLQKWTGTALTADPRALAGNTFGISVLDLNSDGREDILRWDDAAPYSALYLSDGDGKFTRSVIHDGITPTRFRHSNGTMDFITGDFTGRGTTEILRLSSGAPTAADTSSTNNLYTRIHSTPPDLLVSVKTGTGLTTTLTYQPLTELDRDTDRRYKSDRFTALQAAAPLVDIQAPIWVVTDMVNDAAVLDANGQMQTVTTKYAYAGLKADSSGRGMAGFREVRREGVSAKGNPLTTITEYLQVHPYMGSPKRTSTRLDTLFGTSGKLLSSGSNVYCDATAPSSMRDAASTTPDAPCICTAATCGMKARIHRPYLLRSKQQGFDLDGSVLPETLTEYTVLPSGDPLTVKATTSATLLGQLRSYVKSTTNEYHLDVVNDTTYRVGQLKSATVTQTVPNLMPSLSTSAGNSPNATKTQGVPPGDWQPPPSLPPGVLSAILDLLLQD
ncbi:FG-GAP-like repeat-containing protein [Ideonella paludis]|uniref:FG-GAP-like repeat-containing protein n=1 Tax=Ideonella paludis TaxID=1233411 RepID=UPI0036305313